MIEIIEKIVCDARNLNQVAIHTKSRKRELKETRQIVMYFTRRKYPKKSLASIAGYYGQNHATCLNAIKVINGLIDSDSKFKLEVEYIWLEIEALLDRGLLLDLIIKRESLERIIGKYQNELEILNKIIKKLDGTKTEPQITQLKKTEPLRNDFKSPFRELESTNNKPYSGYRQHSL